MIIGGLIAGLIARPAMRAALRRGAAAERLETMETTLGCRKSKRRDL